MSALEQWSLAYLVNALWQAPLVFCAAWTMARLGRRADPAKEHRIWVGALLAEAMLPACPAEIGERVRAVGAALLTWPGSAGGGQVRVRFGEGLVAVGSGLRLPPALLAWILIAYGASLLYFAGRLGWGLWRTRRMRLCAEPLSLSERSNQEELEVLMSHEVAGPVTVGAWHGVVLLPVGFMERVAPEDLCAVLAHEEAHVRRRDFAKNALYGLLTVPVAFHPALWLTRARLAESREMVCDAMAAEAVAGRERYAGSLLRLASMQVQGTPERMLHAIGIFDANSFERRVMNLTTVPSEMRYARRAAVAVVCGILGVGSCATALALRIGVSGQSEAVSRQGESEQIARISGGVMAGNALTKVNPVYPPEAKEAGITGAVVLGAIIGKDGVVENLEVVSGPEKLRASALEAVRQWTYKPYLLNGQPVQVRTTITVNYSLSR